MVLSIFRPKIKGIIGEKSLNSLLSFLPKDKYIVMKDVMLSTDHGTTQIDHIVLSLYGIFVIETKNYNGIITGNEWSGEWTQTIYKTKNKFYNPVKQNYGHLATVKAMINDYPNLPVLSIVAFSGESKLKVNVTNSIVTYIGNVVPKIRELSTEEFISYPTMQNIYERITNNNIKDPTARKTHVKQIHMNISESQNKLSQGVCPKCGANLITRKGKYGEFIGCSNYPKCRFTGKINQ